MESDRTCEEGERETRVEREHVDGVPDGCGCTEIWEHLSERRTAED